MRRVATIGMFDGVHLGHRAVIDQVCGIARDRGLVPAVVTFAGHPASVVNPERAPRLLSTTASKAGMIADRGVRDVIVMPFDHSLRMLDTRAFMRMLHQRYCVDVLVMGYNHRFGHDGTDDMAHYTACGADTGIEVVRAARFSIEGCPGLKVSSSAIRRCLESGDVATANLMLGHPFELTGTVGHGRNVGTGIGFPTANLVPFFPDQLTPGRGVYYGIASGRFGTYPAMVNVGHNPTVSHDDGDASLRVEAHLLGFSGDLYGWPLRLAFAGRLRDERRFGSLAELSAQLSADRDAVRDAVRDIYGNGLS